MKSIRDILWPGERFTKEQLEKHFQDEYERYYKSYHRGCRGCLASMEAIVMLGKRIGIDVIEAKLYK